jgi:hypothetical protein
MLVPSMMSAFNKSDIGKLRARTAAHCEQRVFESRCCQLNTDSLAYQIHLRKLSLSALQPQAQLQSLRLGGALMMTGKQLMSRGSKAATTILNLSRHF